MPSREALVPITMGATGAATLALDDFLVTDARFPARDFLAPHVHGRAGLAIMLEGSFDLAIAHRVYACEPGSAVTEPAEERHDNRLGTAGAHVVVIQPDVRAATRLGPSAALFDAVLHAPQAPPAVCAAAWRIARELRAPDSATPLAVEGLVLEILALATRTRPAELARLQRAPVPRWLALVRDALHARFLAPPPSTSWRPPPACIPITSRARFASASGFRSGRTCGVCGSIGRRDNSSRRNRSPASP